MEGGLTTVECVCQCFFAEGLTQRSAPIGAANASMRKLDGAPEAHLIALARMRHIDVTQPLQTSRESGCPAPAADPILFSAFLSRFSGT